mgnify:CR=1 FL=1
MKLAVELSDEAMAALVPALLEAAKAEGLLVRADENDDPLSVVEAARRGRVSESQIRRFVKEGQMKQVPGTSRMLITAESFRKWRAGK